MVSVTVNLVNTVGANQQGVYYQQGVDGQLGGGTVNTTTTTTTLPAPGDFDTVDVTSSGSSSSSTISRRSTTTLFVPFGFNSSEAHDASGGWWRYAEYTLIREGPCMNPDGFGPDGIEAYQMLTPLSTQMFPSSAASLENGNVEECQMQCSLLGPKCTGFHLRNLSPGAISSSFQEPLPASATACTVFGYPPPPSSDCPLGGMRCHSGHASDERLRGWLVKSYNTTDGVTLPTAGLTCFAKHCPGRGYNPRADPCYTPPTTTTTTATTTLEAVAPAEGYTGRRGPCHDHLLDQAPTTGIIFSWDSARCLELCDSQITCDAYLSGTFYGLLVCRLYGYGLTEFLPPWGARVGGEVLVHFELAANTSCTSDGTSCDTVAYAAANIRGRGYVGQGICYVKAESRRRKRRSYPQHGGQGDNSLGLAPERSTCRGGVAAGVASAAELAAAKLWYTLDSARLGVCCSALQEVKLAFTLLDFSVTDLALLEAEIRAALKELGVLGHSTMKIRFHGTPRPIGSVVATLHLATTDDAAAVFRLVVDRVHAKLSGAAGGSTSLPRPGGVDAIDDDTLAAVAIAVLFMVLAAMIAGIILIMKTP